MKNAREFCEFINMEKEITDDIAELEKKVSSMLGDAVLELSKITLEDGITDMEFQNLLKQAQDYGKKIGEHPFRMQLIFAYYCFALLEDKYKQAGISADVYKETMGDFKFRVHECREVYHFNGIFVAYWYRVFCNLSLHMLDTLEFERTEADFDYNGKGVNVRKGDSIIALHIPPKARTDRKSITRALKESYKFYGFSGKVAYQCDSWLLYPGFEDVFVKGGNVAEFRTLFDVVSSRNTDTFEDCWRLFKVGGIDNLNTLPKDTRLQRNMLKHLKQGGKSGYGFGVLVFDGEKIL